MRPSLSQIDALIQAGLAPIKDLPYARIILQNPDQGITNMVYRDLAIHIFSKMSELCLTDSVLWNRLRALLQNQHPYYEEIADTSNNRLIGTDKYLELLKSMTPGQRVVKTVKKVIKKK